MSNWPEKNGSRHSRRPSQHDRSEHGAEGPGQDENHRRGPGQVSGLEEEASRGFNDTDPNGVPTPDGPLSPLIGPIAELADLLSRQAKIKRDTESQEGGEEKKEPVRSSVAPDVMSAARVAMEKRRAVIRRKHFLANTVPGERSEGEEMCDLVVDDVRYIPLAMVEIEKKFKDARLHEDPLHPDWHATEGQHISDLAESMQNEGLKLPIVVIGIGEKGKEKKFLLRAGGRRRKAALRLGWKQIPAIVLPEEMPDHWQYWYNILENCNRKNLTTYELASSIKHMRDMFQIKATEFARRTGYSPSYVANLLGCIDRLPPYLIEQWRDGARLALDQWIALSYLDHEDAIRTFQRMVGMSQRDRLRHSLKGRRRSLPPARWISRMQKLYVGIEGSELPPRTRDLVLRTIEVCMGQSDDIPGVYEPGKQRKYEAKARLRRELALPDLPDPGEHKEMPPPRDEVPQ